ncbi:uncharacterized protein LOC132149782 [Carassius carassius]|uniref:uncharacterized protein LOC132149782 n=1 Tax=Carassius carassius TaxID=217509 RepID=UPI002868FA81|nr:uncharacterized protein LOC132149782 [Carassius carassius]
MQMHRMNCVLMSVLLMLADGLIVKGPSGPLVAPLGSSVVLPCSVDELLSVKGLEVEWRRTDSETLVHLYQDGESQAESQQQDYQDRAHFFTDQIQHGNFSLRLDNLRAEDEGQYKCKVYIQQESGETVVQIKDVERLLVSGSDQHISASVGEDITLSCSVDSHIPTEHIEEVSWKKTDKNKNILVLVFQNNEILPDSSDEQYRDRVELFSAEIPKGNFSLRLKSVRTEDKGVYMCQVFAGGLSANATVELERLGFSASHIMMLILCISASGSALLLFCLIYCRSSTKDTVFHLQMFLVFCPNILMFLAYVFWAVSEGSLFEAVSCALFFLRPLMLLWAAPYFNDFKDNIKSWIGNYSHEAEYVFFSAVFYSVLFKSALDKSLNYAGFKGVMIIVLFVIVLMFILFYIIFLLMTFTGKLSKWIITIFRILARISFDVLPSLQFILLFFAFGSAGGAFFIVAVLPVFLTVTRYDWDVLCGQKMGCSPAVRRSVWLTFMLLVNAVMVYFYIIALENEKDGVGWACMIAFLQLFWALWNFARSFRSWALARVVAVYVFGSVGVVLLNSVALMTELIFKTVNGEGVMGDMRIVVFSSEFLFTLFLMVLMVFEPWITPCLQSCQKAMKSCRAADAGSHNQESQNATADSATGSNQNQNQNQSQNQNPAESHEMNPLLNTQNQENSRSDGTEEAQPDSVVSQS